MNVITSHYGLSIGDIITAYHAGYHRIMGFHQEQLGLGRTVMLVDYNRVMYSNGKLSKIYSHNCHIDFCHKVDKKFIADQCDNEINMAITKADQLNLLLDGKLV